MTRAELSETSLFSTQLLPSGKIEYYTFKPVAIGTELLVFYGNEYFTDLGYLVEEDELETGTYTVFYKILT